MMLRICDNFKEGVNVKIREVFAVKYTNKAVNNVGQKDTMDMINF